MINILKAAVLTLLITGFSGCGNSSSSDPDSYRLPAGKATLAFTAISTASLGSPITSINMTVVLPAGMNISTVKGTSQIDAASLLPGANLPTATGSNQNFIFGGYSANKRKALLSMGTTMDTYHGGEFLKLVCNVDNNSNATLGELRNLNTAMLTKASGLNSGSSTILTNKVRIRFDLVP